jgi:CubicO group peptidase (beta-lactamase class C family)
MKKIFFLVYLNMLAYLVSIGQSSNFSIEKLDSFISKTMDEWHLPGLAVGIVKKDSIVFIKGYGYRDLENHLPVTPNTVFPVASCSKTFTSALIGMAEKENKIQIDKPVHNYLPEFELYSKEATNIVTARDLLSHRSGSAGHDWAWSFNTDFAKDVYLKRIKYMETFAAPGTRFQYSNFMFFVLSALAEKVHNKQWVELLNEKIFQPAEMTNSFGTYASRKGYTDTAIAYEFKKNFHALPTSQIDDLLGGGSINSTVIDMSRWLQLWINGGLYMGKQIIPAEYINKSLESQIVSWGRINPVYPDEQFENMGLSWFLSSYRGHYRAHHTGNIDGFSSSLSFFPFDSVGIVVLANQNMSPLIRLLPDFISDMIFGFSPRDKHTSLLAIMKKRKAGQDVMINRDTIKIQPGFPIEKYAGNFYNHGYGPLKIQADKKILKLTYYNLKLALVPKQGHRFASHYWEDEGIFSKGIGDIEFRFDDNGNFISLEIPFETAVKNIVFLKQEANKHQYK